MSETSSGAGMSPDEMKEAIAGLSSTDTIESPFGQLDFFDGVPRPDTVTTRLRRAGPDAGDRGVPQRGARASLVAMRKGLRSAGVTSPGSSGITEPRANSNSLFLTPEHRDDVRHDLPRPQGVGADGDRGAAGVVVRGRRLLVPLRRRHGHRRARPGRGRQVPLPAPGLRRRRPRRGYFVYRCPTFTNWVVLRALGGVPAMKQTRIYPLAEAAAPQENVFVNLADQVFNTVHATTSPSSRRSTRSCRRSRSTALDPERAGQLAAIGTRRRAALRARRAAAGHPVPGRADRRRHRPHRRLRSRATRTPCSTARGRTPSSAAATSSCATARACSMPAPSSTTWPPWSRPPWPTPRSAPGRPTPTPSTTATATCSTAHVPTGCTSTPTRRRRTSGPSTSTTPRPARCSRCRRPSGPPSPATPGPSRPTTTARYDLYFGPVAPEGKETNWVETIPGKSWFQLFRLYGPLQPWFDQTWRLNEFEPLDRDPV